MTTPFRACYYVAASGERTVLTTPDEADGDDASLKAAAIQEARKRGLLGSEFESEFAANLRIGLWPDASQSRSSGPTRKRGLAFYQVVIWGISVAAGLALIGLILGGSPMDSLAARSPFTANADCLSWVNTTHAYYLHAPFCLRAARWSDRASAFLYAALGVIGLLVLLKLVLVVQRDAMAQALRQQTVQDPLSPPFKEEEMNPPPA